MKGADMNERYTIKIKVISQSGHCAWGHKVGDEWMVEGTTPGGVCLPAFYAMFPDLRVLTFGGSMPYHGDDPDVIHVTCPDTRNPVVFELRRIRAPQKS
jgi:uncharacterized repeat protein (TIGR04076 family)